VASLEAWHWRIFNVLVRAFGLMAVLCGIVFTSWAARLLVNPKATVNLEGVATAAVEPKLLLMLAGFVALAIGVAIVRARPYRPDLGDSSYLADPFGSGAQRAIPQRRSWWTGDRLGGSSRADA
jgi:hypothetical protein